MIAAIPGLAGAETIRLSAAATPILQQAIDRAQTGDELVLESGDDHAKQFVARCTTLDPPLTADGEGTSRRNAEQAAAAALLEKLDISR